MEIFWLVAFCVFVAIPFYSILGSSNGVFKRRYFPLFVKAAVAVIALIFLAYRWKEHQLSLKFVIVVLVVAGGVLLSILFRYKFCEKCGATNTYYFLNQDRNHCQKCCQPFGK